MMKLKNVILIAIIACIGGIPLFFACKYTYNSKVTALKEKARIAFDAAFEQELKNRKIEGDLSNKFDVRSVSVDLPDSVCLLDTSGKHWYRLDSAKHSKNVTNNTGVRLLHSGMFGKKPLSPDSLNTYWKEKLLESHVSAKVALRITVIDYKGNVQSQNMLQGKWCNSVNLLFTIYIGYACEIEVIGYIDCSLWQTMPIEFILGMLLFLGYIFGVYFAWNRIRRMKKEKIIIRNAYFVEGTPVRSYMLRDNIIFHAETKYLEVDGVSYKIQPQSSLLLELFINAKENDYILKDSFMMEKLWGEKVNVVRLHQAIARLRTKIHEFDNSIDIERGTEFYQLLL